MNILVITNVSENFKISKSENVEIKKQKQK